MLACARIGAIHSVVFGGFAPHELAVRIDDATPKASATLFHTFSASSRLVMRLVFSCDMPGRKALSSCATGCIV